MKSSSISFILFSILFALISSKEIKGVQESKTFVVDILLKSLELDKWEHGESACLQDTISLLNGVKNHTLWATWAWNSMQLPVGTFFGSNYNFGNFDQCLQVPWSSSHPDLQMQYCPIHVKLTKLREYDGKQTDPYGDAGRFVEMKSRRGKRFDTLFFGVCLPTTCKPDAIAKISRHIYQLSNLPFDNVNVDPRNCQVAGQTMERATGFYIFWCLILSMVSISILVYFMENTQEKPHSTVSKLRQCFSLKRNFDALTEIQVDDIKVLHGLRAITCCFIIVIHLYLFMVAVAIINYQDAVRVLTSNYGRLLMHLDTLVDTFFCMSGLLHIRGLITNRSSNILKTLFKRYLRLIVPNYVLILLFFAYVLPHIGSGPAWPMFVRKVFEPCTKSWWKNFLMMGNSVDGEEYCMDFSWYIHCDYQLTLLGTALFIFYRWNKRGGFLVFATIYILSLVIPIFVGYRYELPGIIWYDFGEALDMTKNKVYRTIYASSFNRASSYLIGVAMGYLMTVYRPQDYRKTISKANSILGFIVGFALLVLVLHIGANSFDKQYSALVTAIYASLDRNIWAVGICIIIAVCEYGTLPIINDFLTSKIVVPFSKLSYSNYLCHTVFLYRSLFSLRAPISYDILDWMIHGLGYAVISCCFSFVFWLFIEAPATNVINLLFDNRTNKTIETGGIVTEQKKEI